MSEEAGHVLIETDEHWRPVVHGFGRAKEIAEARVRDLVALFEEWLPSFPRPEVVFPIYADVAREANAQAKREAEE